MDLGLNGRRVLVTGASGGLGRAVARILVQEGASLAITARTVDADFGKLGRDIAGNGGVVHPIALNLESDQSVREAVEMAADSLGGIDGLVNCAVRWGQWCDRIEDASEVEWKRHLRANTEGVFVLVQAAAPHLRQSRSGRVVLVSSTLATKGMVGSWVYATSKAAGHGLARSLAWDLGRDHVLINTVMPGTILVDGRHRSIPDADLVALTELQPSGRLPDADDVADVIAYLVSPRNRVLTGEVVQVTGGTP